MTERLRKELRHTALPAIRGAALVAAATLICFRAGASLPVTAFVYLITILLNSFSSSFGAACVISVLATASLDFFFTEPLFSFRVISAADVAALFGFILTSLVVTGLASKARREASEAERQKRHNEKLYQVARWILAQPPGGTIDANFLTPFRTVYGLKAVCLFDSATAQTHISGESETGLADLTLQTYISGHDADEPASGAAVRALTAGGKSIGAIGFEGLDDATSIAGPLAALAAAGMDRIRAFQEAADAAAQARADSLRAVILDALAHEFKTPLATMLAAIDGLRIAGPIRPAQSELADIVESEISRLSGLTTRLLSTARLDRTEVKPRLEPVDCAGFLVQVVDRYAALWPSRKFAVVNRAEVCGALADEELLRLAISQLLDNACKYSPDGSEVRVILESNGGEVGFEVSNRGSAIPPGEREKIFERFYTGSETRRRLAGTGLGLYVARKIAAAHGGKVELKTSRPDGEETTFRLTLPLSKEKNVISTANLESPGGGR